MASHSSHLDVIKYLVDHHNCDPMIKDIESSIPLHIAALHGHLQVVKCFIEDFNCNINVKGRYD